MRYVGRRVQRTRFAVACRDSMLAFHHVDADPSACHGRHRLHYFLFPGDRTPTTSVFPVGTSSVRYGHRTIMKHACYRYCGDVCLFSCLLALFLCICMVHCRARRYRKQCGLCLDYGVGFRTLAIAAEPLCRVSSSCLVYFYGMALPLRAFSSRYHLMPRPLRSLCLRLWAS